MSGQRGYALLLILIEAVTFGTLSRTVIFPTLAALVAIAFAAGPWRFEVSPYRRTVLILFGALLFVVNWRVSTHTQQNDILDFLSPFLHVIGQFLLVVQIAFLLMKFGGDRIPPRFIWLGVLVMISAGDIRASRFEAGIFQCATIAFVIASALFLGYDRATGRSHRRRGAMHVAVTAVTLAIIASGAVAGAFALQRYERTLDRWVADLWMSTDVGGSVGFSGEVNLGDVAAQKTQRSNDVALRVDGGASPGYLRGRIFDRIERSAPTLGFGRWQLSWRPAERSGDEAKPIKPVPLGDDEAVPFEPVDTLQSYSVPKSSESQVRTFVIRIIDSGLLGHYFLPKHSLSVVTDDTELEFAPDQVVSNTALPSASYSAAVGFSPGLLEKPPSPADATEGSFLTLPDAYSEDPRIQALADQIFSDAVTVEDHVQAVTAYFQANYVYRVGISIPASEDPLLHFLTRKPDAHCEYFAAGATALLRMRGIPTRYVTGFVVASRNELGDYWTASNSDAHAWAEAYDPERGWLLVEATPSGGVPQAVERPWHRQLWDYVSVAIGNFRYEFTRGGWLWLGRSLLRSLMSLQGFAILLGLIAYVIWRQRSHIYFSRKTGTDPYLARLADVRSKVDAAVLTLGLNRTPEEPISLFAARIESELARPDIASWYRDYVAVRYRPRRDTNFVSDLARRATRLERPKEDRVGESRSA
ncbi:transglutaminase family protein [Stratiformator vulcanicus]|uniref:Protein-glutamine gamma-glutamyltransferase n=1 Tax=Stratiformator vulcanicus TaxID=2527980 RepID=A0A517R077_9PLAN|nr:transglutaminase domain-containing protein [Stratiformator vulcanicus]QDT37299.1 Protein-glutamine gamma-glutamyltransferase [Stratiformator vulcanicus]